MGHLSGRSRNRYGNLTVSECSLMCSISNYVNPEFDADVASSNVKYQYFCQPQFLLAIAANSGYYNTLI